MTDQSSDPRRDESSTITQRSLRAIRQLGRNTAMLLKKDERDFTNSVVSLRELNKNNFWSFCNLKVANAQEQYVASNVVSMAEANFYENAWMRGVYADDIPVGFIMLSRDTKAHKYYLWRVMIDGSYQGKGLGRKAMELLYLDLKMIPGAKELTTSYVPGKGCPKDFFVKMRFVHTGQKKGEEVSLVYYIN